MKKIALLNTGDEVVAGDILNRNSQTISETLSDHGFFVNMHQSVRDHDDDMESALSYLLEKHDCVITTGGLGPTSDDRTRFAISNVVKQELEFHEESWNQIVERIHTRYDKNAVIPESNKQQALFPRGATVIHNKNGTANACHLEYENKLMVMLPGPPRECMPILIEHILPLFTKIKCGSNRLKKNWYLFEASEGVIAEKLEYALRPYDCSTGYRVTFPYIEFKLFSESATELEKAEQAISEIISPHLVKGGKNTASNLLIQLLISTDKKITIFDDATGGKLQSLIHLPKTNHAVSFNSDNIHDITLRIKGLESYWQYSSDIHSCDIFLELVNNKEKTTKTISVPFRGDLTPLYAAEYACRFLLSAV